ncbi:uncharacterized protein LOC6548809 isoform X4 [Drosophila erecta]|uniref:Uncharacterized protein, isoform B n=1 Tax=Drosophila erecta TaxID=7220 RepID=B3NQB3_DROER|nr:uncharacterized protein LOC6548809 isoform X4 [Drosophila erecta]EDV55889.2 uncharacterized protein Dere_GG20536, isoform B [Drosophila erecta]
MYAGVWFFGFIVIVVVLLVARECYLFIKLKIDDWNMRVYARLLRHEMMLRLAMEGRNRLNDPEDPSSNHYGDIFFIEPGSVEANRIRDQLEKDEKDLPSYDEVMRMCNLTTPTAAAAGMPLPQSPLGEPGPIGIAALPAPPYSETDPHAAPAGGATVIAMESMEPSTSRAAQIPPSSSGSGPPAPLPTTTV